MVLILVSSYECPGRAQRHTEIHQMELLSNLKGHREREREREHRLSPGVLCQTRRLGSRP